MSHPVEAFVNRLSTVFGEPKSKDFAAYIEEISRHMSKYAADELQEAATLLMQTSKYRTWPLPAEMIEAAETARKHMLRRTVASLDKSDSIDRQERQRLQAKAWAANWLATNDIGRRALLEGWGRILQKLLVQKYHINAVHNVPDLNDIRFPPADLEYFSKHSKPLNPRLDLWVIFGEAEGERWYARYCKANGLEVEPC